MKGLINQNGLLVAKSNDIVEEGNGYKIPDIVIYPQSYGATLRDDVPEEATIGRVRFNGTVWEKFITDDQLEVADEITTTAKEALSLLGIDIQKTGSTEQIKTIRQALRLVDFFFSHESLTRLPAAVFDEYVPDPNRMYNRGEVITINECKYLIQNWGRIDPEIPPPTNPLCKLFRDNGRYDWVREEYCSRGFERYYEDDWYRVIADNAGDNNTPPPALVGVVWERIE